MASTGQPIRLPKLSASMHEGIIVQWLKQEGDAIIKGELLAQIETDKAVGELESPVAGTIVSLCYPAGTKVPTGAVIAIVA